MAVYIPKKETLFIHIPKTGGTSIVSWMRGNFDTEKMGSKHVSYDMLKTKPKNYFTVVRNPYARLLSWYNYNGELTKKRIEEDKWANRYNQKLIDIYNLGFSKSLEYIDEPEGFYDKIIKRQQTDFFDNSVNFILRTETLNSDFKQIQFFLNCFQPLPHKNKSVSVNYRNAYNDKDKKIVGKYFEKDLDILKYTF